MIENLLVTRNVSETTAIGQMAFTSPGIHNFIVPDGVYSISAVTIGGGEPGALTPTSKGGRGGDLRWRNNIPVTPGEILKINVGGSGYSRPGIPTTITRGDELLLCADGGGGSG